MLVTKRLGGWENELIVASVTYDDVTFAVSQVTITNNALRRCRVTLWRSTAPLQAVTFFVQVGQTRTGKPIGTVEYRPVENPDGVTPAGNLDFRMEYPI